MKLRTVLAAAVVGTALLAVPSVAFADPPTGQGTYGTPNCQGLTTRFLAQGGGPNGTQGIVAPGLGNLAQLANLSVSEVHAVVETFCG